MTYYYEGDVTVTIGDGRYAGDTDVHIWYNWKPGAKEISPSLSDPGAPADPDEVEIGQVHVDGKEAPQWFLDASADFLHEYALVNHELMQR